MTFIENFIELFLVSAPWLLIGLVIAGLLKEFVPSDLMSRHLGQEGAWTTIKAAVLGAPLPLCSCGVIPAAMGLRRSGASKSATTAFLVSTPETGVDSVSVSYALLGPFMAIIRPIAAVSSGIVAGLLVGRETEDSAPDTVNATSGSSCCGSAKKVPEPEVHHHHHHDHSHNHESSGCCGSSETVKKDTFMSKVADGLVYSATDLLRDTTVWLIVGLFFAALIQTYVPEQFLAQWGSGIIAMSVMILISVPMYICATASTPIAAGLLLSGVSPGAVLVFMLAGPATNIATLGIVAKELGKKAVIAYLVGVIGTAIVFGYLTDWLVAGFSIEVAPQLEHAHEIMPDFLVWGSGILLAILMVNSIKPGGFIRMRVA